MPRCLTSVRARIPLARGAPQLSRDPPIRNEPDDRHCDVDAIREICREGGEGDREEIERNREIPLEIRTYRTRDRRGTTVRMDDDTDKDSIRDSREGGIGAVERRRNGTGGIPRNPSRAHRHQRKPEEQVHVGPHHSPADLMGDAEEMVMIVPVDTEEYEAERKCQQLGKVLDRRVEGRMARYAQTERQDRDEDRKDAVGEADDSATPEGRGRIRPFTIVTHGMHTDDVESGELDPNA